MSPVVAVKQYTHEHSESPPTENYLNLPASRTLQWNHRLRRCLMPRNVGYIGGPGIAGVSSYALRNTVDHVTGKRTLDGRGRYTTEENSM